MENRNSNRWIYIVLLWFIISLIVVISSCQESGLTDDEIRSLIQEEVKSQISQIEELHTQSLSCSELNIFNNNGELIGLLTADEEGNASFELFDNNNKRVALFGVVEMRGNSLRFFTVSSEYEKPIFTLMNGLDGNTSIMLGDSYGTSVFWIP